MRKQSTFSSLWKLLYNSSIQSSEQEKTKNSSQPASQAIGVNTTRFNEAMMTVEEAKFIEIQLTNIINEPNITFPILQERLAHFIDSNNLRNPWNVSFSVHEEKFKQAQASRDRDIKTLFSDGTFSRIEEPALFIGKLGELNSRIIDTEGFLFEVSMFLCQELPLRDIADISPVLNALKIALAIIRRLQDDLNLGNYLSAARNIKGANGSLHEFGIEILNGGKVSIQETKWEKGESQPVKGKEEVTYRNIYTARSGLRKAREGYLRDVGRILFIIEALQYCARLLEESHSPSAMEEQRDFIIRLLSNIGKWFEIAPGQRFIIPGKREVVEKSHSAIQEIQDTVSSGRYEEGIEKMRSAIPFFIKRFEDINGMLSFKTSQLVAFTREIEASEASRAMRAYGKNNITIVRFSDLDEPEQDRLWDKNKNMARFERGIIFRSRRFWRAVMG